MGEEVKEKKQKVIVTLDDGEVTIKTTKTGWNKESVKGVPVLFAGWQEGKASHHAITMGMAIEIGEKVDGAYLGTFNKVPVYDPKVIHVAMLDAFCEKYEIEPQVFKIAADRTGAKKNLSEIAGLINADTIKELETSNPELAAKLASIM